MTVHSHSYASLQQNKSDWNLLKQLKIWTQSKEHINPELHFYKFNSII